MDKDKILKQLNETNKNTMMETMGITYTEFTGDRLSAEMEVGPKVHQPYGLLHGGASAALAETVGSFLSALQYDFKTHGAVGTNLNIYHLNSVREGKITATAKFIRKGNQIHVIEIEIYDANNSQISRAILTTKIIEKSRKFGI
ncbi:MAG: hotdog fold thioesterase [Flavobacteriaceae bacterium]|nr:hotdog fold thioesterase [Flavobacteriaceae bacterium]